MPFSRLYVPHDFLESLVIRNFCASPLSRLPSIGCLTGLNLHVQRLLGSDYRQAALQGIVRRKSHLEIRLLRETVHHVLLINTTRLRLLTKGRRNLRRSSSGSPLSPQLLGDRQVLVAQGVDEAELRHCALSKLRLGKTCFKHIAQVFLLMDRFAESVFLFTFSAVESCPRQHLRAFHENDAPRLVQAHGLVALEYRGAGREASGAQVQCCAEEPPGGRSRQAHKKATPLWITDLDGVGVVVATCFLCCMLPPRTFLPRRFRCLGIIASAALRFCDQCFLRSVLRGGCFRRRCRLHSFPVISSHLRAELEGRGDELERLVRVVLLQKLDESFVLLRVIVRKRSHSLIAFSASA
eukprot:scaffold1638_cov258-Pinguiococcus_pyrenoidosus.AAC.2